MQMMAPPVRPPAVSITSPTSSRRSPCAWASTATPSTARRWAWAPSLASNEYHRLTACEDVRGHVLPYAQVDLDWLRDYFGEKLWPAAYSENAHDCLAQVTPERLTECWPEMRRIVASIPEGETVRQRLQALGAKQSLADLGVPEEKLPELLRISPLIRNRLTLMRTRGWLIL